MSESPGSAPKAASNGIQGLAMMAPVVGVPVGVHALGGALVVGAGIMVTLAPIAVPAAAPLLAAVATKGGLQSLAESFFPLLAGSSAGKIVPGPLVGNDEKAAPKGSSESNS